MYTEMQEPSFRAHSIVPPRRQHKLGKQYPSDARRASALPPKDMARDAQSPFRLQQFHADLHLSVAGQRSVRFYFADR